MNRKIKLSAMNCHHRFYTLESFFANAKANGYSCVELWTGPQHFYMDYHGYETIAKLKDLEHRYGIKIIGICPEQTNPKPNNMAVRDSGMQLQVEHYFKNAIDAAVEIKANQVVVTSGWAFLDEPREDAYQRSVKMLQKISEYAEQKGMLLAIEALQRNESVLVNSVEELQHLLKEVQRDALKVCLDTGAMAMAGNTIQQYFDVFHDDIIHAHFVDVKADTTHLAWGDGERNMKEDLQVFIQNEYHGVLSVECVNSQYFENPSVADEQSIQQYQKYMKELYV